MQAKRTKPGNSRHDNRNEQRLDEIYGATQKDVRLSSAACNGEVSDRPAFSVSFDCADNEKNKSLNYSAENFQIKFCKMIMKIYNFS